MPQKPKTEDAAEQSRRFVETACKAKADDSGKTFERAIKLIKTSKRSNEK